MYKLVWIIKDINRKYTITNLIIEDILELENGECNPVQVKKPKKLRSF